MQLIGDDLSSSHSPCGGMYFLSRTFAGCFVTLLGPHTFLAALKGENSCATMGQAVGGHRCRATIAYMFVRITVYHAIHNDCSKHRPPSPGRWRTIVQNTICAASNKFEDLVPGRRAR